MPRRPRFAPPGYFLHIVQRGNYRQRTFFSPADFRLFLDLLAYQADSHTIDLLAYCLMPNHFHLIARAHHEHHLSRFMQALSGHYAQLIHGRLSRRGRFWQERFYSCVLDESHLLAALRYVELNPVRAHLVANAAEYPWSSAALHTQALDAPNPPPDWLDLDTFRLYYSPADWRHLLDVGQPRSERAALRRATQREIPLGPPAFLEQLTSQFGVTFPATPLPKEPASRSRLPR